jgi:hypothetical protein
MSLFTQDAATDHFAAQSEGYEPRQVAPAWVKITPPVRWPAGLKHRPYTAKSATGRVLDEQRHHFIATAPTVSLAQRDAYWEARP